MKKVQNTDPVISLGNAAISTSRHNNSSAPNAPHRSSLGGILQSLKDKLPKIIGGAKASSIDIAVRGVNKADLVVIAGEEVPTLVTIANAIEANNTIVNTGEGASSLAWIVDGFASAMGTGQAVWAAVKSSKAQDENPYLNLTGVEAAIGKRQNQANAFRRVPGTQRDAVDGGISWGMHVAKLAGDSVPSVAGSVLSFIAGPCYAAQGISGHRKAERSSERAFAVKEALGSNGTPPNLVDMRKQNVESVNKLRILHDKGSLSDTACAILLHRTNDQIDRFLRKFEQLDEDARKEFNDLLHHSGLHIAANLITRGFNKSKALNSDAQRWVVRSAMIDRFIDDEGLDLDAVIQAGALAGGEKVPRVNVDKVCRDRNDQPINYPSAVERGVARLKIEDQRRFAERFATLDPDSQKKLGDIFHFSGNPKRAVFSKNGVLNNSSSFRSQIRTELARLFVQDYSLNHLQSLKEAYNCRVIGISASEDEVMHGGGCTVLLKDHVSGFQDLHIANLREEMRHTNVQTAYGAVQLGIATAMIPAAGPLAFHSSAVTMAPFWYPYAVLRGQKTRTTDNKYKKIVSEMKGNADQMRLQKMRRLVRATGSSQAAAAAMLCSGDALLEDLLGELKVAYIASCSQKGAVEKAKQLATTAEGIVEMFNSCMQAAKVNPFVATRWFFDDLNTPSTQDGKVSPIRTAALQFLRDCQFGEWEISDLCQLEYKAGTEILDTILYGESLRRRFSNVDLDQKQRDETSQILDKMFIGSAGSTKWVPEKRKDGLQPWKIELEKQGVKVIGNPGRPGTESLVRSLVQSFSGASMATTDSETKVAAIMLELHRDKPHNITNEEDNRVVIKAVARAFNNVGAGVRILSHGAGSVTTARPTGGLTGHEAVLFIDADDRAYVLHKVPHAQPAQSTGAAVPIDAQAGDPSQPVQYLKAQIQGARRFSRRSEGETVIE